MYCAPAQLCHYFVITLSMPSKAYQKRQKSKQRYQENTETQKVSSQQYYREHRQEVTNRVRTRRSDERVKKHNQQRNKQRERERRDIDDNYKERNRQTMRERMRERLQVDQAYKEKNKQATRKRLQQNHSSRLANLKRAQNRLKRVSTDDNYKQYKRTQMYMSRHMETSCGGRQAVQRIKVTRKVLTNQQKYWIRRSRLLAASRLRQQTARLQHAMVQKSSVSMLDVQLLFTKADNCMRRGLARLKQLHSALGDRFRAAIDQLPTNRQATEDELTAAMEGIRMHTSCSETYFWEHAYKIPVVAAIPIDTSGQAHLFTLINTKQKGKDESGNNEQPVANNTDTPPENGTELQTKKSSNATWECNPEICFISQDMIDGVVALLQKTVSTSSNNCVNHYLNLDNCNNTVRNAGFGHPMNCELNTTCNSLLRPARILSCHYPFMRTSVYKVYELRRLSFAVHNIRQARTSGTYAELERAVDGLSTLVHKLGVSKEDGEQCQQDDSAPVSQAAVMQQFGKALRTVTNIRDTYVTQACDVCDQLRKDLSTLSSYENKKGFSSEKMTQIIDLLYQRKTQHEDIGKFLESMFVCKYCADRLRGNNDVARCAFNKLEVVPTPECIQELNIFEKTLIKYCLTCITVVRLGQVSNSFRPHRELNAALKGRIAYLPLDLTTNASFVPDVLNADSLVLLVGGQPTKSHKVWTSVVDLRKVHKALMWLREHNPLYKEIPAYTVQEMERIIQNRVSAGNPANDSVSDNLLLKRLNDAAKSHLYESFSVQPISNDFPADTLIDYQLDKVNGQSSNIFDADLDLKAYPELFPTGENGMKDATRSVKIGTSDFIKSRLLNRDPKFRLNTDYLFHSFQVQEISNMCHSVGHMLRTITGNKMTAEQLLSRLKNKDGELHSKMFALMANLRGSREYFSQLGMDVRWMIRHLGPPTLFITCSASEWFSEPFIEYLRQINSSVPNIGSMTPAEVCAMDPVNVSIHFNKKWNAIFQHLIRAKEQPIFGEVVDYFWRVEYQCRGAPHVHCLLWIKDAPVLGQSSSEDVQAYLNKIVTCSMPDAADSPTLHELVTRFQTHKCNRYCRKLYKQNGKFYQKCRFGFPRPIKCETELNDYVECLAVNASKQPRKRLYHLKRSEAEVNVNDYNAALLMANQSNVDVQFIGHLGSRLPYYICDYMTKNENSEQDDMWHDIYLSLIHI